MKVYIDGNYYDKEQACVSVFDHGLLYGDGVFEGIRIYNGTVFKLREHIVRLYQSAKAILLHIPMAMAEMQAQVEEVVKVNNTHDGYIRLVVTRGRGDLGLDPAKCPKASVIIIVADVELYPPEYYAKGIEIITSSSRRLPVDGLDPRIKSLNYLNNIMAKLEAKQAGCLEAVMLNKEGYVAECTGDNIFVVKEGRLYTPTVYQGALDGITRATVLELAQKLNIPCEARALSCYDLYNADECFLTGSGAEVMPVTAIDGRRIGDGKPGVITHRLLKAFREFIAAG
ncbi:MAG: branched-chain-amino-acid transaminase [Spirochaetales bacterium]|nr:branched-chain-amino-acid transaminase [Spirochaetales bacterium]